MKKLSARLLLAAGLAMALGLGLCACTEPAAKATLTLNAGNGGTLEETSRSVEVGTPLADALKDLAPVPEEGLTFAGWYSGDSLIENGATMPEEGLSLTAKYYATYTVESYYEQLAGGYGEPETATGTAIYGEPFTYAPDVRAHYSLSEEAENRVSSEALEKGETFTLYFDLAQYTVVYYPAAPEGAEVSGQVLPTTVLYGTEVTIEGGDALEVSAGYRFGGWATEEGGMPVYKAGDRVTPESDLYLFAVWDEAYFDRFGGGDLLFIPTGEENTVVLLRAGEEHRGVLSGETFTFGEAEAPLLQGKLNPDGTFVYYREAQRDVTYSHLDAYTETMHADGATLTFDGEGGATYSEGGMSESGTLTYDPEMLEYTFVYADGKAFRFSLSSYVDDAGAHDVFLRRGAEYGIYFGYDFHYTGNGVSATYGFSLYLDGFGIAAALDTTALLAENAAELLLVGTYEPISESEIALELFDADYDIHTYRAKLLTYNGYDIWVQYFADYAQEFTAEDGAKLTLDGYSGTYQSATYTPAAGESKKGMYVVEYSPLGDTIRFVEAGGAVTTFRISPAEQTFSVLGGGDYTEYLHYVGGSSPLAMPVLVFGEGNKATLSDGETTYEGTVSAVEGKQGRFLFTSDSGELTLEYELGEDIFSIDGQLHYVHYYVPFLIPAEGVSVLPETEGEGELSLNGLLAGGNAALYTDGDGNEHAGVYALMSGADFMLPFDLVEFIDFETGAYSYFRLVGDMENGYTAVSALGAESGIYYLYNGSLYNGSTINEEVMLMLMGSDEEKMAMYMDMDSYAMGIGTYTYDDATGTGTVSYMDMDSESDETFSFLLLTADGELCFARHTDLFDGTLVATSASTPDAAAGAHTVSLDGYGFGTYDGVEVQYVLEGGFEEEGKENVYRFHIYGQTGDGVFEGVFDIDVVQKTYTACGYEVGQYYADDGSNDVLILNGYGVVTRCNITVNEGGNMIPLERGKYHFTDAEEEIVLVTFEEESYLIHIYAMTDGEDYINYYTKAYDGAGTYRSERWELLTLTPYGTAVYTDVYGISYEGSYTNITGHVVTVSADGLEDFYAVLGEKFTFTAPTSGYVLDGDVLVKYLGGEGKNIRIPDGVKEIAPLAFSEQEYGARYRGADIETLDLNGVEIVGANAFNGCAQLLTVTGGSVRELGASAFYACIELKELTLPKLEKVGEFTFHLCESLVDVELAGLKAIASSAFSECYALETVSLPAIQTLEEGVFYNCYALQRVTLGATLARIGSTEEYVAGVFGRDGAFAQVPLTVVLEGATPPEIGTDLFEGVTLYTVEVPTMSALKAFYAADSWKNYNANLGVPNSTYDGVYYRYSYGVSAYVLGGVLRQVDYGVSRLGAYDVRDNTLYLITFDPDADAQSRYKETAKGVFLEDGVFLYDIYGYGMDEENYQYLSYCVKAGQQVSFDIADGRKLTFTPEAGDPFAASSTVYAAEAVINENGVAKQATVRLEYNQYYSVSFYMVLDGYRYSLSPSASLSGKTVSLGEAVFDPIVTRYTAEDGSMLALSQNDEDGTKFTVSFVLASVRDEDGAPFSAANVDVSKGDDGTYTTQSAILFAGYSYMVTFTLDGDAFSYSLKAERQVIVLSEDGLARVIFFVSESGAVTSITLYCQDHSDWEDVAAKTKNLVYTHEEGGLVYRWFVYEYNYAGDYILTLTGSGDTLDGTLTVGKAVKGYQEGVYVILFYGQDGVRTALWMHGADEIYEEIGKEDITEKDGYLEVSFRGGVYYVTPDVESGTAAVVIAQKTYPAESWSDYQGELTVSRDQSGEVTAAKLTVEGKVFEQFYVAEGGYVCHDGTTYYYVSVGSSSCEIYDARKVDAEHAETKFAVSLIAKSNGDIAAVLSVTLNGEAVGYEQKSMYVNNTDYLQLTLKTGAVYLVDIAEGSVVLLEEVTVTTEDGAYRFTLRVAGDLIIECIKFEKLTSSDFEEKNFDWAGNANGEEGGKPYNYEVDTDGYATVYYFEIVKQDGTWTAELVKIQEW